MRMPRPRHAARIGRLAKGCMRSPCRELVRTLSDRGKTAWEIVETLEVILDMVHKYGAVILYAEAEKVLVSNRVCVR